MSRFVTLLLGFSMASLLAVIYLQLDRPVARVVVDGPLDAAEQAQIRAAVLESLDGGLLSADLQQLEAGIMALDWPRAITIRRAWPDALLLEVEKPAVIAGWQEDYLASDGRIVRLPGGRSDLPRFDCRIATPRRAMEIYYRLNEAAAGDGLAIEHLMENELGEWKLSLRTLEGDGLLSVTLGARSMQERFERFLVVYRQRLSGRTAEVGRVDARYDNGVAVSWLPGSTTVAMRADRGDRAPESI